MAHTKNFDFKWKVKNKIKKLKTNYCVTKMDEVNVQSA